MPDTLELQQKITEEMHETLHRAKELAVGKDIEGALKEIEAMVKNFESSKAFTDVEGVKYFSFREQMEMLIYLNENEPKTKVESVMTPISSLYQNYGYCLIDTNRLAEAAAALDKAMEWNPIDPDCAFERAEICKIESDMEDFKERTVAIFPHAYRNTHLARCYRNLGYYFVEMNKWHEAVGCYVLSMSFATDKEKEIARQELYYISKTLGRELMAPPPEYLIKYAKDNGFPIGPDRRLVAMAKHYAKEMSDQGNANMAKYFGDIAEELGSWMAGKKN